MKHIGFGGRGIIFVILSLVLIGFVITKNPTFDRQAWFYPQKISKDSLKACYKENEQGYVIIQNKLREKGGWLKANRARFVLKGYVYTCDTCQPECELDFVEIFNGYNYSFVPNKIGTGVYIIDLIDLVSIFDDNRYADFLCFIPFKKVSKNNEVQYIYYWVIPNKDKKGKLLSQEDIIGIENKDVQEKLRERFNSMPLNPSPPRGASKQ